MSLENRLEEFPTFAEGVKGPDQNGETPPILPKPAQLTGQSRHYHDIMTCYSVMTSYVSCGALQRRTFRAAILF